MFLIVGFWGSNEFGRVKAAFYFFYYSFISSFFLFFLIVYFSVEIGTLDFLELKGYFKIIELLKFLYPRGADTPTITFILV